jgi:hypothetical protein
MTDDREHRRQIVNLEKERRDMLVVIDTLQQILGRAEAALKDNKEMYNYVFTTSAKWSMSWKPESRHE